MLFSIITATLNNENTIAKSLHSLYMQKFTDFEHIIVDGGSKDNTLTICRSQFQKSKIEVVPGCSLYQALNYGIKIAKGKIITWLHADDFYIDDMVFADIAKAFLTHNPDIIYGNIVYVDKNGKIKRVWKSSTFDIDRFYWGWMPPHTSLFVQKYVFDAFGYFREDMGQSADYEWILRTLLKQKSIALYIDRFIVAMHTGGISNKNIYRRIKAHIQDWKAWKINNLKPKPWTLPLKVISKISQVIPTNLKRYSSISNACKCP